MVIKVGINGYGSIGRRVADAVSLQKDMKVAGVTARSYGYKYEKVKERGFAVYTDDDQKALKDKGLKVEGGVSDLLKKADIVVDCTPAGVGEKNKPLYVKNKVKAIFEGGEDASVAETSFNAQSNYDLSINKDYVRVVSCNTTGLCRTLHAIDQDYGIKKARVTLIRRAADPDNIKKGPINSIVPVLHIPSHHGPDVKTVLPHIDITTTAVKVPTTLMHLHTLNLELEKKAEEKDIINSLENASRIRLVNSEDRFNSTAEIMDYARDLGHPRSDIMEVCVWEDSVSFDRDELYLMMAIHQESIVVPENIDAIRAMSGFRDSKKSIEMTNKALGIR